MVGRLGRRVPESGTRHSYRIWRMVERVGACCITHAGANSHDAGGQTLGVGWAAVAGGGGGLRPATRGEGGQGFTLVHFSAQHMHILWDAFCA